jgi:hypothetical protein
MKKFFIALGSFLSTICLSTIAPAYSQTVSTCPVYSIDAYIPVEQNQPVELEPAYITGSQQGSRVNVRTGPGARFDANTYGLVGDAVQVIGQAFSTDCETWFRVRFPISGHIGWIHGNFIELHYGRGWWD